MVRGESIDQAPAVGKVACSGMFCFFIIFHVVKCPRPRKKNRGQSQQNHGSITTFTIDINAFANATNDMQL